jgi:hypothetical protein
MRAKVRDVKAGTECHGFEFLPEMMKYIGTIIEVEEDGDYYSDDVNNYSYDKSWLDFNYAKGPEKEKPKERPTVVGKSLRTALHIAKL